MKEKQNFEIEGMQIDLLEVSLVFLKKWWLILIVAILGTIAGTSYTKMTVTPTYSSSALLYILPNTTSVTSVSDLQFGTVITNDFIVIATSKPVVDKAIDIINEKHGDVFKKGQGFTRGDILGMISITNMEDTRILKIQATSTNAEYACWVANAMAEATAERMQEITKKDPPTTVEKAEVSTYPSDIGSSRNGMIGFIAGAALVCGVLLVLYLLNDNIRTEEDVEKYLGEVALVSIPYVKGKGNKSVELSKQKRAKSAKKSTEASKQKGVKRGNKEQ